MIKKILLSLLILLAATSAAHAEEETPVSLAEVSGVRVGYGQGTIRIVVDISKKVDFVESYAENPSRMIIDLKNSALAKDVPREIELNSLAAKKIRVAQFDKTTVRIVVETMADTRPFHLPGGSKGHRLVIDVGNSEFKPSPEPQPQPVKPQQPTPAAEEPWQKQQRELKEKQEAELRAKQG